MCVCVCNLLYFFSSAPNLVAPSIPMPTSVSEPNPEDDIREHNVPQQQELDSSLPFDTEFPITPLVSSTMTRDKQIDDLIDDINAVIKGYIGALYPGAPLLTSTNEMVKGMSY